MYLLTRVSKFTSLNTQKEIPLSLHSKSPRPVQVQQFASQALQGWYGAGYWKDFEGRRLLCEELGIPFVRTWFDPADVLSAVEMVLPDTTDVIVEYSVYPELMQALRQCHPRLKLHVRAHNAETLQHLHRNPPSCLPTWTNARLIYGAFNLAMRDRKSACLADTVLGISEYDNINYWRYFVPKQKLYTVPYFSPWPELRPTVKPRESHRKNQILCMPGGYDRLSQQQRQIFFALAKAVQDARRNPQPDFMITDYSIEGFAAPSHIKVLGQIDEPWDLMCQSKGLAVLTNLGFGAKTTIPDAITAGCLVIVHKLLVPRIPTELQDWILPIDPDDLDSAACLLLDRLNTEPVDFAIANAALRKSALAAFSFALKAT